MNKLKIVIIDGDCEMCLSLKKWIEKKDTPPFQFKVLDQFSKEGKSCIQKYQLEKLIPKTIVVIEQDKVFLYSDALLQILEPFSFFHQSLKWVPRKIRNALYSKVALNRHLLFKNFSHKDLNYKKEEPANPPKNESDDLHQK